MGRGEWSPNHVAIPSPIPVVIPIPASAAHEQSQHHMGTGIGPSAVSDSSRQTQTHLTPMGMPIPEGFRTDMVGNGESDNTRMALNGGTPASGPSSEAASHFAAGFAAGKALRMGQPGFAAGTPQQQQQHMAKLQAQGQATTNPSLAMKTHLVQQQQQQQHPSLMTAANLSQGGFEYGIAGSHDMQPSVQSPKQTPTPQEHHHTQPAH